MLFRQNKRKTGNNVVKMSQAFQDIGWCETFHRSKPVQIILCVQCYSKLGKGCFTILFNAAYFLLAVMVEGDESRGLRITN